MNFKNVAGVTVVVLVVAFAIQLGQQNKVEAQQASQSVAQKSSTSQNAQAIEYAMLEVGENDTVTWLIGGNDRVRTESVKATYRRLGGKGRGSFSDLLNQIGSDGWNLVQKDGNTWIFSRRAR